MKLYGAIDLHSNNNVTVLIDEQDQVVYQKRLPNDLPLIAAAVVRLSGSASRHRGGVDLQLVLAGRRSDGAGHEFTWPTPRRSNSTNGLKYTDDHSDARWLAHILRLGVLPEGYIYPKQERAVRDLLRKRSQMVRQRTANLLSIQNLMARNTGSNSISAKSDQSARYPRQCR
jgi:transposase